MEKILEKLQNILEDPSIPEETKTAVKSLIESEKARQEQLADKIDKLIKGI